MSFVQVPLDDLEVWGLDDPAPSPAVLANELILWIGDHQENYAEALELDAREVSAWIGAPVSREDDLAPIGWLLNLKPLERFIEVSPLSHADARQLTFDGWAKYEALKQVRHESRNAFMAMKFGDDAVRAVLRECFKPAVAQAGFTLKALDEDQAAGCIDDQMRVALRGARFVVADLTYASSGAYWEAGFAEGLGRPVIYTCRKAEWEREKTHFDTEHLVTIIWNPDDLDLAGRQLTATIRATLPAEATMGD